MVLSLIALVTANIVLELRLFAASKEWTGSNAQATSLVLSLTL